MALMAFSAAAISSAQDQGAIRDPNKIVEQVIRKLDNERIQAQTHADVRSRNLAYVKRILLADDSDIGRKTLRKLFEESGWSVCGEAANGEEAIAKVQELKPDLVVLDLSMPVMNGLTAGRILKQTIPQTRLILFTSFGALLSTRELEPAGFSASIPKDDAGRLITTAQTPLKSAQSRRPPNANADSDISSI